MYRWHCAAPLILATVLGLPGGTQAADPFRFPEARHGKGQLKYINGLPVLMVEGTPEEIGTQTGTLTARAGGGLTRYFKELMKTYGLEPAWPVLVKTGNSMLKQFPSDYRKELEAGLKVSGIDREIVIVGNTFWDISKLGGCSTLIVEADHSSGTGPLFGRNFDFPTQGILQDYSLVVICRPAGKHAFAGIGFPGLIGCASGMNDAGLALATLDVESTGDGSPRFDLTGTPLTLTFRRILEECTTVEEAEKLLRSVRRTTWMNLAVCDRKKGVVFEITPKTVLVRRSRNGICACTNHFRVKGLATSTKCPRYDILMKSSTLPKLGLADVARQLHAVNQGRATLQTMIFEPATLRLHLAIGKGPTSALPLKTLELAALFKDGQEAVKRK